MKQMRIRHEASDDESAIDSTIAMAFRGLPYSNNTEAEIVRELRHSGGLTISMVAEDETGCVVGHIAFSPVSVPGVVGWYGLGPIAVSPDRQRAGIGTALVQTGLDELSRLNASGCVVLGDPMFYKRFGFSIYTGLLLPGVPAEYFQALLLNGDGVPMGAVTYHPAFSR